LLVGVILIHRPGDVEVVEHVEDCSRAFGHRIFMVIQLLEFPREISRSC
jgi:hypothetical protein